MTRCRLFLLATVQILCVGCVTGITGGTQRITVRTDPPGANVVLSTGEKGITPYTVSRDRNRSFSVYVYKKGYKPIGIDSLAGMRNQRFSNLIEVRLAPLNSPDHSIVLGNEALLPEYRTLRGIEPESPDLTRARTYVATPKKPSRVMHATGRYRTDANGTQYLSGY
ncbi:MAG TPA: PEGA domain-containing protein [Chthoniobacterales bacterium]